MHTVVETPAYLAAAKSAGVSEAIREEIVSIVASDPTIGVELRGTGGCRKFRIARQNEGKSAGYRVVHFYTGTDIPVFLLTVFAKGEKDNISDAEANLLAGLTKRLVEAHRRKITTLETKR
jgi:hypothetical protein